MFAEKIIFKAHERTNEQEQQMQSLAYLTFLSWAKVILFQQYSLNNSRIKGSNSQQRQSQTKMVKSKMLNEWLMLKKL